ncbi:TPA: helix-turn-helix domain-containing protein [Clostridioides difficile]|nr:helix-turn-helix domain-containing protein [Clostridioides difficile]
MFKKKGGYTFTNFLSKVRVEKSKKYILKKNLSILDVAVLIGFNSQNYYSIIFKKFNNFTPIEYKNILHY